MGPRPKVYSSAPIDVDAVQAEIDATGKVTLPIAGRLVTLDLRERDLYGSHGREIYEVDASGRQLLVGFVTARNYAGTVVGEENSAAFVTVDVGQNAVLGTVYAFDRTYNLRGEDLVAHQLVLETAWMETPTSPPTQGDIRTLSATYQTFIRVFSDEEYRSQHSDWTTRISSAFNQQHGMWDNEISVHQWHGPYTSLTTSWSTGCSTHAWSFRNYIDGLNPETYNDDAYQIFTGVDLSGDAGCAFGPCTLRTQCATSIIEAHDHSIWDTYDPDESDDLGLVSGQELGHNYGEISHPNDQRCEAWFLGRCVQMRYNIMSSGTNEDDRTFWFTSGLPGQTDNSRGQIRSHSHPQLSFM